VIFVSIVARPGAWTEEHAASEDIAEASPAAASPVGPTQTSSEQNSSPPKLSAPGRTYTAPRSDGSTGSLDPALYPAHSRASPHSLALDKEPSLDTALNLVAQSRTNLVALEAQQPPLTALQAAAAQLRTDSPSLPASALAGASRDLGARRAALPGSHSAPAIAPESYFRGLPAPEPLLRPASRNSGAQGGGDSGVVAGSRQQSRMEATLFPEPEPAIEPAAGPEQHRNPAAAAKTPLWKRIEAAERAAAAAADRAEAEAAGLLFTRDRRVQHDHGANGRGPGQADAARRTVGSLRDDASRMSAVEEAAAALKQVRLMLGCS